MTRKEIAERLQLPIMTLCLAAIAKGATDIAIAKTILVDKVEELIKEASK